MKYSINFGESCFPFLTSTIFERMESDPKLGFLCVFGEVINISKSKGHLSFKLKDENSRIQ